MNEMENMKVEKTEVEVYNTYQDGTVSEGMPLVGKIAIGAAAIGGCYVLGKFARKVADKLLAKCGYVKVDKSTDKVEDNKVEVEVKDESESKNK